MNVYRGVARRLNQHDKLHQKNNKEKRKSDPIIENLFLYLLYNGFYLFIYSPKVTRAKQSYSEPPN